MKNDHDLENIWKHQFRHLEKWLGLGKIAFFIINLSLMALYFMGKVPFYSFFIYIFVIVILSLTLLYFTLKCPNCDVHLLTKNGIEASPHCYNCGLKLSDGISYEEKLTQSALEKMSDQGAKKVQQAEKIAWTRISNSSSSSDEQRLVTTRQGDLSFKATWQAILFGGIFSVVGIIFGYLMFRNLPQNATLLSAEVLVLLIPALFTVVGAFLIYTAQIKRVFSLAEGVYQKGREKPILLIDISALQLLSHEVSSEKTSFTNYELNLVLSGNKRQNIVHYANKDNAQADAQKLGAYLGVKVLDGV